MSMVASSDSDDDLSLACAPPKFIVLGAAGDGKSSLINALMNDDDVEEGGEETLGIRPRVADDEADGVTKEIRPYTISNGMVLFDTMGIGDGTKGIADLIAGVRKTIEDLKVDGIIVTSNAIIGRFGTAMQIVQQIVDSGMVKNTDGISPWERVIVCGTQRDICTERKINIFQEKIGPKFFQDKNCCEVRSWQVATSSINETDGMEDLLACMQTLVDETKTSNEANESTECGITWDPQFDENNGSHRMAVGVCQITGGSVDVEEAKLEMKFAWDALLRVQEKGEVTKHGAAATSKIGAPKVADLLTQGIQTHVEKEILSKYAANAAISGKVGSGIIRGGQKIAIGNDLGTFAMDKATAGVFKIGSSTGIVVVDVGARAAMTTGIQAGASIQTGVAGGVAQYMAGRYEITKAHQKKIGFCAQVTFAGVAGSCTGGPIGGATGAAMGAVTWLCGDALGDEMEKLFVDSNGENHPALIRYNEAKAKYDIAVKTAKN